MKVKVPMFFPMPRSLESGGLGIVFIFFKYPNQASLFGTLQIMDLLLQCIVALLERKKASPRLRS
jgi:hypothetical protein